VLSNITIDKWFLVCECRIILNLEVTTMVQYMLALLAGLYLALALGPKSAQAWNPVLFGLTLPSALGAIISAINSRK